MLALVMLAAGIASWFTPYQHEYDGMAVCAMLDRHLIGQHVTIESLDNGRRAECVVIGTGPFVPGRVIDVSPTVRKILRMDGLARVRVWLNPCRSTPQPLTCIEPRLCVLALPEPVRCR